MSGDGVDFLGRRALCQAAGIPAGDQRQVIGTQHIANALSVLGKLAVELEAFVTDGLALTERSTQRRLPAQGRQVIVTPGDRVDANSDVGSGSGHGCTFLFLSL